MTQRLLLEVDLRANGHGHRLRVVEETYPDGVGVQVEVAEPDKCACVRRIAVSELAHLLLNIREEDELWTIPSRDRDAAGHLHPVFPGLA